MTIRVYGKGSKERLVPIHQNALNLLNEYWKLEISKHNIQILQNLSIFNKLGCNVLIGLSRKRFISDFTKKEKPADRIAGTIAANQYALENGADIIRVHDVKEALQAKLIWQALKKKIK